MSRHSPKSVQLELNKAWTYFEINFEDFELAHKIREEKVVLGDALETIALLKERKVVNQERWFLLNVSTWGKMKLVSDSSLLTTLFWIKADILWRPNLCCKSLKKTFICKILPLKSVAATFS